MNTKSIALVVTFSAVAIALNTIKIPTLYWPGNFYQVCEIPIVIALLLFGFKIGVFVAAINLAGQLAFFLYSPVYIVAYPVALIAVLLMLSGVYLANIFISRRPASGRSAGWKRSTLYLTAFAVLFRGGIMPLIDAAVFYRLLLPLLGYPISDTVIIGLLPVFILFNATTPLYTVPLAYFSATKASALLRIKPQASSPKFSNVQQHNIVQYPQEEDGSGRSVLFNEVSLKRAHMTTAKYKNPPTRN